MRTALPSPGDVVWIRQSRWRVERVRRERGVLRLDVASTLGTRTFLAPFDRPVAIGRRDRPRHVRAQHARARLASVVSRTFGIHSLPAAGVAAVRILPYQLEPSLAFATGARRVLIADDVGLGKTIQAGAVIAELVRREPAARILVLVPSALRRQWIKELGCRFRIIGTVADTAALDRLSRSGARSDSPWRRAGVWIASSDFVKQPHVLDALPIEPWDLIVIDEAHSACGESSRHDATDRLSRRSRRVLLLTATPHGGDEERFQRLISTGALTGVDDPLIVFRRTRRSLGLRVDRRVRWHPVRLSDVELRVLDVLMAFERTVLRAAGVDRRDHALLLLSVFRKRALSSMTALAASLARRRVWLEQVDAASGGGTAWQPSFLDSGDGDDVLSNEETASIAAEIGLTRERERSWLSRLQLLADAARRNDRRLARLVQLVRRTREPVAIFTEFRDSLNAAAPVLAAIRDVATLHGGQSSGEQHRELDRFLSGGASVLLATDVASQGLNLQSRARWVISLELPWNPARIEQRAGRVDRIGQARPVHVTLLIARHDAESGLLARLARRACAAQRSLGADVLRDVTPDAARVRAALLSDTPLDLDDHASARVLPVAICTHFERPARAVARRLLRQRALGRFGREPSPECAGPIAARSARLPAIARVATHGIVVFAVPLSDRAGAVVEQHAVAVRVAGCDAPVTAGGLEACRRSAERHLVPRFRRLKRIVDARSALEGARERAIAHTLSREATPQGESEPGLFDQRVIRDLDRQRADADAIRIETERRLRALSADASLEIGRAVLELVLT